MTATTADAAGNVSELWLHGQENMLPGETDHFFTVGAGNSVTIPDGSRLVVAGIDAAGAEGLSPFQIGTIDLRFGEPSQMSLTEDQVLALSDTSDPVVVSGGADDTVTLTGAQRTGATTLHG